MNNFAFVIAQNKKVILGYFFLISFTMCIKTIIYCIIFLIRKKAVFKNRSLKKNSKTFLQKVLEFFKFIGIFQSLSLYVLIIFKYIPIPFLNKQAFGETLNSYFFQFGLFLYYKFVLVLPHFYKLVFFLTNNQLFDKITFFIPFFILHFCELFTFFRLFLNNVINFRNFFIIFLSLFEIFLNIVIVVTEIGANLILFFALLASKRSLTIFLEEFSTQYQQKSLGVVIFFPILLMKTLKKTLFLLHQTERNKYLLCVKRREKIFFVFSRTANFILIIVSIQNFLSKPDL